MGIGDKIENAKDKLVGGAKEKYGDATDNESLQAEGAAQKTEGQVGDAAEHMKDDAHRVADHAKDDAKDIFGK